jgi:organic radical activating enzyme
MKIPIKIISPKKLRLLWQITTACTYTCSYCPKELHTGRSHHIDLDELDIFLDKLSSKEFTVNFTGGEPTIHPQYLDIIKRLHDRNIRIISDTNISRTERFYEEASQYVDNWCASIHPSMFVWNEDKIKILADNSYTVVYLMMDPDYWDLAIDYWHWLKTIPRIKIIPVKCLSNWSGSGWYGKYTEEQQNFLSNTPPIYTFSDDEIKQVASKYSWLKDQSSQVIWDDNTLSTLEPDQLMIEDQHKFKGWHCEVGEEVITLDPTCSVSLGTCGTQNLGNWSNFDTASMTSGIICPREYCHCGVDIRTTKYKL